jgi:hypothetical protein
MNPCVVFGKVELACLVFLVCNCVDVNSQSVTFETLRFEEDYSALRTDSIWPFYSRIKGIHFGRQVFLAFGGDARYQYFKIENEDWGETPESSDGFLLARHLLYANLQLGKHWRVFGQLQNGVAAGKHVVSPVDENILEAHQLFVDYSFKVNNKAGVVVRLGRQEILYGSQRLVSVRNGPNTRQSFDGISSSVNLPNIQLDFFSHCFVQSQSGAFNDHFSRDVRMWGTYLTRTDVPYLNNIDVYYIGLQKLYSHLDDGAGRERRHSFGARIWKNNRRLKYDMEALFQSGRLADDVIRAWTISFNTAYTFDRSRMTPQLGLKTEIISGNRQYDDGIVNTFNPLFPSGAYFGLAALFGPSNLFDVHPYISLSLSRKVTCYLDYDIFWRMEEADGIYTNNNVLIYTGRNNPHKFIGQQFSMTVSYSLCPFASVEAEFKWFDTGKFLKTAGEGKDILFLALTIECIF